MSDLNQKLLMAQQAKRVLQLFAGNLNLSESEAMEIADLYEPWEADKRYLVAKILKYGVNQWGETQLYAVLQEHVSQADWTPDGTAALYKAIGFKNNIPSWTQPLGAQDAYQKGDEVYCSDEVWVSDVDNNVWQPGVYGWVKKK
jgi:hypothetical protein